MCDEVKKTQKAVFKGARCVERSNNEIATSDYYRATKTTI